MENIAKAVVKAQAKLHNLGKNATGHNYKYLTLDKLIEETRGILAECGLAIIQPMAAIGENPAVKTILLHESGEMIEGIYPISKAGMRQCNDAQQMGAAVTYARRYGLAAMLNIAQADDDGACIGQGQPQQQQAAPQGQQAQQNAQSRPVDALYDKAWGLFEIKKANLKPEQAQWCMDTMNIGSADAYSKVISAIKDL